MGRRLPSLLILTLVLTFVLAPLAAHPASSEPPTAGPGDESPRALDERALDNLEAFTRLFGVVRFFHPSDEAAALDQEAWNRFALAGVQSVEDAPSPAALARALEELFAPIAPTVQVFPSSAPAPPPIPGTEHPGPADPSGRDWVAWLHQGVSAVDTLFPLSPYHSNRVTVGSLPENTYALAIMPLDHRPLAGHTIEISAAARVDGQGLARLSAFSPSGPSFQFAPITSPSWERVSVRMDVPPGAYYVAIAYFMIYEGTLDLDDVQLLVDGLDRTAELLPNPSFEDALPGYPPAAWTAPAQPFGTLYDLSAPTGDAYSGERMGRLSGPRRFDVPAAEIVQLAGGVTARVPLALPRNADGETLSPGPAAGPLPEPDKPAGFVPSAADRATRLAGVALTWPVLEHFYPYFDAVGGDDEADWNEALRQALREAALDTDIEDYDETMERMLASLYDGHARLANLETEYVVRIPFTWDEIEGALVVTWVPDGDPHGVAVGDRVVAIDGLPTADAIEAVERRVSGATAQWRRFRTLRILASGRPGESVELGVGPYGGGTPFTVAVPLTAPAGSSTGGLGSPEEPRPPEVSEIEPGVWYVDLTRIDAAAWEAALPSLAVADGIVFDFRGYPSFLAGSERILGHLITEPVQSQWFGVPTVRRPGRKGWQLELNSRAITPREPHLAARKAFLVDGRVISAAETWLGYVEASGVAELVGGPTAGTNGNINPFFLPDGSLVIWTGMDVRKQSGAQHHAVGIQPTVPVERTLEGVVAGVDELLEAGVEAVREP